MKYVCILVVLLMAACTNTPPKTQTIDLAVGTSNITAYQLYVLAKRLPVYIPQNLNLTNTYSVKVSAPAALSVFSDSTIKGTVIDSSYFLLKQYGSRYNFPMLFKVENETKLNCMKAYMLDEPLGVNTRKIDGKEYDVNAVDGCFVIDSLSSYIFYTNTRFYTFYKPLKNDYTDVTRIIACNYRLMPVIIFSIQADTLKQISEIEYNGPEIAQELLYNLEEYDGGVPNISTYRLSELPALLSKYQKAILPQKELPNSLQPDLPLWLNAGEYLRR